MVLEVLITGVSAAVLAAYMWSLRGHFVTESMPMGARVITGVVTLSAIGLLYLTWFESQPVWAQVIGLIVQMASGALFALAVVTSRQARLRYVFDPEHPHSLLEDGPYKYIRHPFYTSYVLFWGGWAIATWSLWGLLSFAVLTALYVRAARMEEGNFAASPMADTYAAYKTRTGFFWPRV